MGSEGDRVQEALKYAKRYRERYPNAVKWGMCNQRAYQDRDTLALEVIRLRAMLKDRVTVMVQEEVTDDHAQLYRDNIQLKKSLDEALDHFNQRPTPSPTASPSPESPPLPE